MKRFLFATLGGLLVALSIGLFGGSSASAASVWDNVIKSTDKLEIGYRNTHSEDITLKYVAVIEEACGPTIYDLFVEQAVSHQKPQAITAETDTHTGTKYVQVAWGGDPDVIWSASPAYNAYVRVQYNIELTMTSSGDYSCSSQAYANDLGYTYLGYSFVDTRYVFLNTYNPNYPPDYEGEDLPDTWTPATSFDPQHTWSVDRDGTLRVVYDKNFPGEARGNSYWELLDTSDDPVVELDTRLLTPYQTQQYTFELPGPGTYELAVGYTGDLPENWEDFNYSVWNSSIFSIKWDGASFITGNNHDRTECDFVVCYNHPQEPLGGAFGTLNPNMHGLQNVVLMPINFLGTLPSYVDACQPISVPILGSSQELPCLGPQYASINNGFIYGLWQTVITATVTFGVAFHVFRIIKNVNSPKDDGIEMEKL